MGGPGRVRAAVRAGRMAGRVTYGQRPAWHHSDCAPARRAIGSCQRPHCQPGCPGDDRGRPHPGAPALHRRGAGRGRGLGRCPADRVRRITPRRAAARAPTPPPAPPPPPPPPPPPTPPEPVLPPQLPPIIILPPPPPAPVQPVPARI